MRPEIEIIRICSIKNYIQCSIYTVQKFCYRNYFCKSVVFCFSSVRQVFLWWSSRPRLPFFVWARRYCRNHQIILKTNIRLQNTIKDGVKSGKSEVAFLCIRGSRTRDFFIDIIQNVFFSKRQIELLTLRVSFEF